MKFLGALGDEDIRVLYRRCRALVHPAIDDFGIVMVEALACGTPVIAAARGGARDIVKHGANGWVLTCTGVEHLRSAIRRAAVETLDPSVIRNSAERFSRERFRQEFSAVVTAAIEHGVS